MKPLNQTEHNVLHRNEHEMWPIRIISTLIFICNMCLDALAKVTFYSTSKRHFGRSFFK